MFLRKIAKKLVHYPLLYINSAICLSRHFFSALGLIKAKNKVFAIGFNKTGTVSLHEIFTQLGYHSNHGEYWRTTSSTRFHMLFDAFCDGVPVDFVAFDTSFTNSKFILQVRDLDTWIASRVEHIERRSPDRNNKISEDWTTEQSSLQAWVKRRNDHHLRVISHFKQRPNDLLIINFIRDPDAATKIALFLNADALPSKPHANKNKKSNSRTRHSELISNSLTSMSIPESEWGTDLICASLLSEDEKFEGLIFDTNELN